MNNDPTQYPPSYQQPQPGPYDKTVPVSSAYTQPAYPQTQPTSYNPQQPAYGIPNQNLPDQENNHRSTRKSGLNKIWIGGILTLLIILIVVGAAMIANQVKSASSAVNDYYAAVKQQDYAKAYSYVRLGTFNNEGIRLYTVIAQGFDKSRGPVLSYSEQSKNSNGDTTVISESIQRNGPAYIVHLTLKKLDGEWRIISFTAI